MELREITPVLEPVHISGNFTGQQIIRDLCSRIADKLSRDDRLRATDVYRAYCAEVVITLQDVDTTTVAAQVKAGNFDAARPVECVTLATEGNTGPDQSLEHPVVPEDLEPTPRGRYPERDTGTGQFVRK
jgi:hypothetical protein